VETAGNPDCHIILRGGRSGPNYGRDDVAAALRVARTSGLGGAAANGLIVDASHGNSGKDHVRQAGVVREIADRIADGERGITGLMMESFLVAGAQKPAPLEQLTYGQSVTDACMDWDTTEDLLRTPAKAVRDRRRRRPRRSASADEALQLLGGHLPAGADQLLDPLHLVPHVDGHARGHPAVDAPERHELARVEVAGDDDVVVARPDVDPARV